jgi:hypothetical protein
VTNEAQRNEDTVEPLVRPFETRGRCRDCEHWTYVAGDDIGTCRTLNVPQPNTVRTTSASWSCCRWTQRPNARIDGQKEAR